jgi:hypothetical protein
MNKSKSLNTEMRIHFWSKFETYSMQQDAEHKNIKRKYAIYQISFAFIV